MASGVDQEVLWLDVPVHDIVPVNVVQSSQELVGVQLGEHRMHLLTELLKMLLHSIDISWHVVHHDIQLRRFFHLSDLLLLDEVGVEHTYDVLMVQFFVDLQLSIFVVLVLCDFLDGDIFTSAFQGAHVDSSEGTHTTLDLFAELVFLLQGREAS